MSNYILKRSKSLVSLIDPSDYKIVPTPINIVWGIESDTKQCISPDILPNRSGEFREGLYSLDYEKVANLLDQGISLNIENMHETPLQIAIQFHNIHMVILLLNAGADPYLKNINGQSALDYAINISQETKEYPNKKHEDFVGIYVLERIINLLEGSPHIKEPERD